MILTQLVFQQVYHRTSHCPASRANFHSTTRLRSGRPRLRCRPRLRHRPRTLHRHSRVRISNNHRSNNVPPSENNR